MNRFLLAAALTATTALSAPAYAVTTFSDLSAWQASVTSFVEDTNYGTDFADIGSVSLNGGADIDFSSAVSIRTVPGSWATWSGGYTDQVLYTNGATSLTGTFTSAVDAFGFFSQPNPFSIHAFTLNLSDGSSVSGDFSGSAGAGFLGWTGAGISSFTISSDVDFAIGDFFVGTSVIPEPATWLTMITGFGLVGGALRRRTAKAAIA